MKCKTVYSKILPTDGLDTVTYITWFV